MHYWYGNKLLINYVQIVHILNFERSESKPFKFETLNSLNVDVITFVNDQGASTGIV